MIGLLFNFDFWIWVGIFIAIVVWLRFCSKYESFKVATLGILAIALVGFTGYSAVNLGVYYNAQGGIYGVMEETSNSDVKIDGMSFEFSGLNLTQVLDSNTYRIEVVKEPFVANVDDDYGVFVNGILANNSSVTSTNVSAEYRYIFNNADGEVVCDDTLDIVIVFNKNNTHLLVETNNPDAVDYWHSYFNNNGFVVTLDKLSYIGDNLLSPGEGIVPGVTAYDPFIINAVKYVTKTEYSVELIYGSDSMLCAVAGDELYRFDFATKIDVTDRQAWVDAIVSADFSKYYYANTYLASVNGGKGADKGINYMARQLEDETRFTFDKMYCSYVAKDSGFVGLEISLARDINNNIVVIEREGDYFEFKDNSVDRSEGIASSIIKSYQGQGIYVNRVNNPYVVYAKNIF